MENTTRKRISFIAFLPAVAWLALCTIMLAIPGNDLPSVPFINIPYFDKLVHLAMFVILVALFCWPLVRSGYSFANTKSWLVSITLYALAYGIIMEFVQKYLVRNRSFDVVDILFDAAGCIAGAIAVWKIRGKKIGPDRHRGRNQN